MADANKEEEENTGRENGKTEGEMDKENQDVINDKGDEIPNGVIKDKEKEGNVMLKELMESRKEEVGTIEKGEGDKDNGRQVGNQGSREEDQEKYYLSEQYNREIREG